MKRAAGGPKHADRAQLRAEVERYADACQRGAELLKARPGDDFHDLFPGTGGVTEAWEAWASPGRGR